VEGGGEDEGSVGDADGGDVGFGVAQAGDRGAVVGGDPGGEEEDSEECEEERLHECRW